MPGAGGATAVGAPGGWGSAAGGDRVTILAGAAGGTTVMRACCSACGGAELAAGAPLAGLEKARTGPRVAAAGLANFWLTPCGGTPAARWPAARRSAIAERFTMTLVTLVILVSLTL